MNKYLWKIKLWWLHRKINKTVLNRHFWATFIHHVSLPTNVILGTKAGVLAPPVEDDELDVLPMLYF